MASVSLYALHFQQYGNWVDNPTGKYQISKENEC